MKGSVLNIQKFCTRDGPGIRTTVFLKGCPLRCLWCHNPESQRRGSELLYGADKCVNCLRCVSACPQGCHTVVDGKHVFHRDNCIACGACLSPLCQALEASGKQMTVEMVLSEVLKDRAFYENSGGGMTLSGGEPFCSPLAFPLLRRAKEEGIHTCVETCGYVGEQMIAESANWVDLYLFDYKETDPEKHKEFTGVDNAQILRNLRLLDALGKEIILRCPVIPTLNDREDHFRGIAELANELPHVTEVVIEPYHTFGISKYDRLDRAYAIGEIPMPSDADVERWIKEIRKYTDKKVIKA